MSTDAYALFLRCRAAVSAVRYPGQLAYTIAVSGIDGKTKRTNRYRAYSRPSDGAIDVAPISSEEMALAPPVPHGFKFALTANVCEGRCDTGSATLRLPVGRAPDSVDLLGVPILDPTYTFGLVYARPRNGSAQRSPPSTIPTIAVVSTNARDYAVTLIDETEIDGAAVYHLRLQPLRKPHDNRLRELWIGANDFLPRKAIVAGDFTIAPFVDVPWTIDFAVKNGAAYIEREAAASALYLAHRRVVRDAVISFRDVRANDASIAGRPLVRPERDASTLVEP